MHACSKNKETRKKKEGIIIVTVYIDKIGMGYESLHIIEFLIVQCLKIDDVIPILSPC